MSSSPILQGKRAVVFGAGGSIGGAVAKEFAREGAEVFLAGRTEAKVEDVAKQITAADGRAHSAVVDAYDDAAVNAYIAGIVKQVGGIDIEFNAAGPTAEEYGAGLNAADVTIEQFMVPVNTLLRSQFITARAAARHMAKQRAGAIIFLTASTARGHVNGGTPIGAAFGAIESLMENLAFEFSPVGVRVVCLRTTANTDTKTFEHFKRVMNVTQTELDATMGNLNFLKVAASMTDTAKLAALLGSDRVRMMTGTVVNSTAGAGLD